MFSDYMWMYSFGFLGKFENSYFSQIIRTGWFGLQYWFRFLEIANECPRLSLFLELMQEIIATSSLRPVSRLSGFKRLHPRVKEGQSLYDAAILASTHPYFQILEKHVYFFANPVFFHVSNLFRFLSVFGIVNIKHSWFWNILNFQTSKQRPPPPCPRPLWVAARHGRRVPGDRCAGHQVAGARRVPMGWITSQWVNLVPKKIYTKMCFKKWGHTI